MAEEQNQTVDVAAAAAPAAVPEVKEDAAAAPQTATEETTAAEAAAPAAEDKPADDAKPAETTEEAEGAKEEVKPIEEGHLGHKAQGAGFPKNLIATKTFFSFGSEAMGPEALAAYRRLEKHGETAVHNISWAAHTAKGLLFIGDKKAPTGIINLSDASEPELDGAKGFHFTARGSKHTFKAASIPERDSWVATLNAKIAEAKELATSITETDIYKQTVESFKPATPATPAKEEKPEEPSEEAPKTEEGSKPEEAPKEEGAAAADDSKADDSKDKRRSASRKRASFFGFVKREEKEETKPEESALSEAPVIEAVPEAEDPATEEAPAAEEAAAPAAAAPAAEDKPVEEPASPESPKEKASKRTSFFGNVFSKKEKKVVEAAKTEESPKEEAETTDSAPVIPPVEATTPLAVDVSSPEAAPAETVESPVAAGEGKKESREKRKSSLPFNFGKREKSPAPGSEESKSTFSKLRATIKGKSAPKTEEKPAEEAAKEEEAAKDGEPETVKEEEEEAAAAAEAPATEETPKADDTETSKEGASAAPAVTAAA